MCENKTSDGLSGKRYRLPCARCVYLDAFDFSDESLDAFTDEVINNRIVGAMYTFRPNYEASMNSITTSTAWLSCEMHKRQTAIYRNMLRACPPASLT
jgi:hypothetical protein